MDYNYSEKMKNLKPSAIREIFKSLGEPGAIPFSAGNPSPESFPVEFISAAAADIFATQSTTALQYSITEGYPLLREALRERLRDKFSSVRDTDSVIVVSGGQQGIELTCKVMCNEGDAVICENPSFIGALNSFRSLGVTPVGVELDSDGINIEALRRTVRETPRAKLLYVIPTFHNPAGITMSEEKRREVYKIAKENGLIIIEDNPYGELRFSGEDVPTIKSMDEDGIVVYCGSFSKILSAGIRVGFVCAPSEIAQKITVAKQVEDVHTNIFFQMVAHRFMTQFDMEGHLDKVRALYRRKSLLMLKELDRTFPSEVSYTRPDGGLFLWCTLPAGRSVPEFVKAAAARKVFVVPGTAFNCDTSAPSSSFRLNYSTPADEDIVRGIGILADILKNG